MRSGRGRRALSATARALGVTHVTIARRLAGLEDALGLKLFERRTDGFRLTAQGLSAVINGVATILLFVLIDPQLSVMTDDVVEGRISEASFRRAVVWLAGSRILGTLLAQILLVPAAMLIAQIARVI